MRWLPLLLLFWACDSESDPSGADAAPDAPDAAPQSPTPDAAAIDPDAAVEMSACRMGRAKLCAAACACGADITCVFLTPLPGQFSDEAGCVFLSNLQCNQYEASGATRDWSQCERDLDGAQCEGTGADRGVPVPESCQLTGDDPLGDID